MAKFTSSNQPLNRKPRGKGKKTILREQVNEVLEQITDTTEIGINPIEVKKTILAQLLSKETNSLAELDLINRVVSDLLVFIPKQTNKEVHIIKEEQDEYIMSTAELIEQFQPNKIEDNKEDKEND